MFEFSPSQLDHNTGFRLLVQILKLESGFISKTISIFVVV